MYAKKRWPTSPRLLRPLVVILARYFTGNNWTASITT